MRDDLTWWRHILNSPALNGVPLGYFNSLPEPDVTVITDASDAGICALVPTSKLDLTYQFSAEEQALVQAFNGGANNHFDINYRELLACAFAFQTWGSTWQRSQLKASPLHIHFRIDNTSAIAWQAKMSSKNPRAQLLIRLLCLWEHQYGIRLSASHIPGAGNTAGSRYGLAESYARLFDELTRSSQPGSQPSQPPGKTSA